MNNLLTAVSLPMASGRTCSSSSGSSRNKHHVRAAFRAFSLLALVSVYGILQLVWKDDEDEQQQQGRIYDDNNGEVRGSTSSTFHSPHHHHRELDEAGAAAAACGAAKVADPKWMIGLYVAGVLYLFLALAIVCDEFFVPSLEEMSSSRRLNLSMDVAGATLMAAGGSAPELFTALFGTFRESAVGFGTIVGSAVFNVLFVIGVCSLCSKEILRLTWWPLFRDSTYYLLGLVALGLFVGVNSVGRIEVWEAAVLLVLYFGYVGVMAFNGKLYSMITGGKTLGGDETTEAGTGSDFVMLEGGTNEAGKTSSSSRFWNGTFRAGILKLLEDPSHWAAISAGSNVVAKISGNVDDVFVHVDKDRDGNVNKEEFQALMEELECHLSEKEFDELFTTLDTDKNGVISKDEFTKWYILSEKRMLAKAETTFKRLDTNQSGTIERNEVRTLLTSMDPAVTEEEVSAALQEMNQSGDMNEISMQEFHDWYVHSFIYQRKRVELEEESEGIFASLRPPSKQRGDSTSCLSYAKYILCLPLVFVLAMTVPDTRRPGRRKYCYLTFILAIAWIGVFSYFMVDWAGVIGATVGIPDIVMGLTFLAAGTSVPDLLSSVIVARMGQGDMAVSSSIGSNIFDILVGLPLPWLIYTAYPGKPSTVEIGADGVGISLAILIGMIILIITTIHCNGWKLTKAAGVMMFVFYFAFLAQAIYRELPFQTCGQ